MKTVAASRRRTASEWHNRLSYVRDLIFENGVYKLVALFVTLILWVTILGRRDVTLRKDVDVEFLTPRNLAVQEPIERRVAVKVSGPRVALKKFQMNPGTITIDLSRAQIGLNRATIGPRSVDVPFGVKVESVEPEILTIVLAPSPPQATSTPSP